MNNKVLSLIKEAEAHYQELEKDHLVRLMPFQHFIVVNDFNDDFKYILVKFYWKGIKRTRRFFSISW